MTQQVQKDYLQPEDVKPAAVKKVLSFLNTAKAAEEIAGAIEIPGERDVGIKVAQNIIARRTQLGGFKDLRQVAAVSQIGPERFTQIINALAATKEMKASYIIEGQVKGTEKIDFGKAKLAVHAFIGGVEVAKANIDAQGKYKLAFEHKEQPSATELWVLPAKFSHRSARTLALSKTISASRYVMKRENKKLEREVELLDRHQLYRCCPEGQGTEAET